MKDVRDLKDRGRVVGCSSVLFDQANHLGPQGYLAHKKQPPPWVHHRAPDTVLLYCPRGMLFFISEIPL